MRLSQVVDRDALQEAALALAKEDDVLAGLQLEVFPEDAKDYVENHFKSKKGAVVSSYAGSRKTKGGEHLSEKEFVLDWQVLSRYRTGERGALRYIRHVEAALEGARLKIEGDGGARWAFDVSVSSDQFTGEHKGVWMYTVKVRCQKF
jgi:hypothetical protein